MLKLSFFIVLVLAGLCFGTSKTEEGVEGTNNSGGTSSGGSSSSVGDDSHKGNKKDEDQNEEKAPAEETPKESPSDGTQPLGYYLPDFIGDAEAKKNYVTKLVSKCSNDHYRYKINEHNITFPKCTYRCISESGNKPTEVLRIPEGMVCNEKKDTCPETGDCPEVKEVPSC
uniref:Putative ixodes 8-cys protein n=1 Tax=Ixodes ricinus TaxID=34613 RepID=A0A0K8RA12_IXORI